MRANSRVHLLSEGALIGLLHRSEPLEIVPLVNFQSQQASDPLSTAVLGLIREVTFNSEEDNYKGLFM